MSLSLLNFPNEILYYISKNLKAEDLSSLHRTCRFFFTLTHPLLDTILTEDKDGLPALCWAASNGYVAWCILLLKKGVDINTRCNDSHFTALHYASLSGYPSLTRLLLRNGANTEALSVDGETPLHIAATNRMGTIVSILLKYGADVNAVNHNQESVLSKAIQQLVNTSEPNNSGGKWTQVLQFMSAELATMRLLKGGADIFRRNIYGEQALHEAAAQKSTRVLQQILKRGADIGTYDNYGNTALHIAVIYGCENNVLRLLNNGADVDAVNSDGDLPLHLAVESQQETVVRFLLRKNANCNLKNSSNYTPLSLAVYRNYKRIVKLILRKRPCFEPHCNAQALYIAVSHGFERLVELLLRGGADVSVDLQWNPKHQTVLHHAVKGGYAKAVKSLLKRGASLDILDQDLKCAFCVAQESGDEQMLLAFAEYSQQMNELHLDGRCM